MTAREVSRADTAVAYQSMFRSPEGEIVLAHLVKQFGYTRKTTMGDSGRRTHFNEGQRSVIQAIGWWLDADPGELMAEDEITEGEMG